MSQSTMNLARHDSGEVSSFKELENVTTEISFSLQNVVRLGWVGAKFIYLFSKNIVRLG